MTGSFDLLLTAESLFPPRTGIGNYTFNLHRELLLRPEIGRLVLLAGLRRLESVPDHAATPAATPIADRPISPLRRLAHESGLAMAAWSAVYRARLRLALKAPGSFPGDPLGWVRTRRDALYHEPNMIPRPYGGICVSTFQDLAWHRFPDALPVERLRWIERHLPRALAQSTRIITTTDFVRREVMSVLGVPGDRVDVVPLGVGPEYHPRSPAELEPVLSRHGLEHGRYLLTVGTIEPRKNLRRLLAAYGALPASVQRLAPLVVVGASGWRNAAELADMDALVARGAVRYLGYVGAGDLPFVFAGARGFAAVSLYEGYGLPPLEAMASGVPVLCSAGTAMEEVTTGCARLADPLDEAEIGIRLRELVEDEDGNRFLVGRGLRRSAALTWAACAEGTIASYRMALGAGAVAGATGISD
ncbi:glycosyltransferase family 4 protein [Skermanella stibiiresistens]|uniref:glycosyltransferase family 4 protein n=1 Tax=Skermanella stibiiresistens TaxID=913326 RepID=UPI001FDF72A0|nr:glycosyltransferase family 1 protein [Skermanella stibiiresistens]